MFVCPECGAPQPAQGHCPADGTPLAPRGEDLLLGTMIGAYRVARLLGIGGMGRVYTTPARKPSRKGLWITAGVLVLVSGGIVAAVVSGKSGSGVDKVAAPADPGAPAGAGSGEDSDDDDDASGDPASAAAKRAAADPTADAFEQLDETIRKLPPAQQKRFAAYKNLSKLPPAERMKRLREITQGGLTALEVEEPAGGQPLAPVAPPPGGWVTSHEIDPPPGYDPAHVDVNAFVPWAIAQAKKAIPDAQLIRIDTNGVSADGRADLTLPSLASDHGSIDVRFISPSRGKRDPGQPLGVARRDFKCEFRVEATPSGVEIRPIDFVDCAKERVVPPPKCSFAGVWKKAIARKAPSHNAVGNVDYRSNGSRPVWYFAIGAGFDVAFSEMFGDDC